MPIFRGVAFGCLHAPITHPGYFDWLIGQIEEFKPDYLFNLGDWYEGLAGSRHSRDPRHNWTIFTEHNAVKQQAEAFNLAAPNATKYWVYGNHDDNLFGIHADRVPEDLREVVQWNNHEGVRKALEGWRVRETYKHGERVYLGQISLGHGCPVTESAAKDEVYSFGVPYGLDIRSHTHRPEPVTQARERKVVLPYYYANTGTGADWDKMHYMDRQSKQLWGRGAVFFEVSCRGEGKEVKAQPNWEAETRVHSTFAQRKVLCAR